MSEVRLDIEKTVIRAPFNCRISEVNIELNQFAPAGRTLVKAVNISKVEIPVQLAPTELTNLMPSSIAEQSPLITTNLNMDSLRKLVGISATVRIPLFSKKAEWEGTFMRMGDAIDLDTGAITVYVAVDQPYEKVIPSERPPLVPNLYTEVELSGSPKEKRFVIPFHAIHNGFVHLVDAENRLKKQEVSVEMVMGDMAVIRSGLLANTKVITTDLVPAIAGMLLEAVVDEKLSARINNLDISR